MHKLDQIDLDILAALQADGRTTNVALARQVGLSPTPCLERVKSLEAAGIIKGYAASLAPADPRLAELYAGSCKACHVVADSGAPLVHDAKAWAPRWKQGEAVLLDHVVQGYKAMPAMGQCASCTPDDFKALTRFMAGQEGKS